VGPLMAVASHLVCDVGVFLPAIPEHEGRVLRVVVNAEAHPERVVTAFFDRRLRRRGCD